MMSWVHEVILAVATAVCGMQPITDHPALVTSYWPFQESGERMTAYNGQCNDSCAHTANGTQVTLDLEWESAACITPWLSWPEYYTVHVYLESADTWVQCNDTYGAELWRDVFFNEDLEMCVIGVDVMTDEPLYELTSWRKVTKDATQ